jgi:anti-sigma-K factor RskA
MTCQEATISLGVYLLGALDSAESAAVEAHLDECADCRKQLDELAGLPSVLERLELADLEPLHASDDPSITHLPPSEDLFSRVAAQAEEEATVVRRVRFGRFQKLSAAAAAVVLAAGVGIGVAESGGGGSVAANVTLTGHKGPVDMRVVLTGRSHGTTMHVTVAGVPADEHCRLIAIASDGTRRLAGQWDASYAGWADFNGSTSVPLDQISKLVLRGSNGQRLVTVTA